MNKRGLTTTELKHSTGGSLLADCASGSIPIKLYKKQIATLSLYNPNKRHTYNMPLTSLRGIDVYSARGTIICLTQKGKPRLTLEFL